MTSRIAQAFSRHGYILALVAIAVSTGVFLLGRDQFAKGQWALLYLLVILLVASAAGPGPAVLAAVLAFFAWNFFFLPPYHTLQIRDPKDWLSLVAFLVVGVIVGALAGRMRDREAARPGARAGERRAQPAERGRGLADDAPNRWPRPASARSSTCSGPRSAALYVERDGALVRATARRRPAPPSTRPSTTAPRWPSVGRRGGDGVPSPPAAGDGGLYVPVRSPSGVTGVLTVQARGDGRAYGPADTRLVTSLGNMVGAFLERERLQQAATSAAAARRPTTSSPACSRRSLTSSRPRSPRSPRR